VATPLPAVIRIGGLFSPDELEEQLAFHAVLENINNNYNQTIFQSEVLLVPTTNGFVANMKSKCIDLVSSNFLFFFLATKSSM